MAAVGGSGSSTSCNDVFFMMDHAPVGAWSSMKFGRLGRGVRLEHQGRCLAGEMDLLVAVRRGDGASAKTVALPFVKKESQEAYAKHWEFVAAEKIQRHLSACVDEFVAEGNGGGDDVVLKVYTQHASVPNPKRSGQPQFAVCPGLLVDVTIDNSKSSETATAFVGVHYGIGNGGVLRALDYSTNKTLAGVGFASEWAIASLPRANAVFTGLGDSATDLLNAGRPVIQSGGCEGGVLIRVPAGQSVTVPIAVGFYHGGAASQGIEGSYFYTKFFPDLESVCRYVLVNAAKIRDTCSIFNKRVETMYTDEHQKRMLAKGLRAYSASTQYIESNAIAYWTLLSGGPHGFRNAIRMADCTLGWELYRNPWVVRNMFDLFSAHYSYRDQVTFEGESEARAGGLSFCHDVGMYTAYGPVQISAYEHANQRGVGSFMTTEATLAAVYMLTGYALNSDDEPWCRTRVPTAGELLESMENRDHGDPEKRDGILKAQTMLVQEGEEITCFDAGDEALRTVPGNLYLAVKTWCANLLLTAYFQQQNQPEQAQRAYNMAHLTAESLLKKFDAAAGVFPANLVRDVGQSHMLAAIEPMALVTYCHLKNYFEEFPELMAKLKTHAETCLKVCVDVTSGKLKMSDTCDAEFFTKAMGVVYVLQEVFNMVLPEEVMQAMAEETRCSTGMIASAWGIKDR